MDSVWGYDDYGFLEKNARKLCVMYTILMPAGRLCGGHAAYNGTIRPVPIRRCRVSKSSFIGVGAAFLMAFVLLFAYGNSAYAGSPTGSISGKITKDSGSTNVQGAAIFVTDFTTGAIIGNATSTASGTYTVGSLDAGTFRVQVNATDQGLPVLYYNGVSDADSATSVSVAEHAAVTDIDIDLTSRGLCQ